MRSLYRGLRKARVLRPGAGWRRLFAAGAGRPARSMAAVVWWLAGDMRRWFAMHTFERIVQTAVCVVGGAAVYFAALYAAGTRRGGPAP